jgi:hypothetical protein
VHGTMIVERVRRPCLGIIGGVDYQSSGAVRSVDVPELKRALGSGSVVPPGLTAGSLHLAKG